jgi:hypothetical protein
VGHLSYDDDTNKPYFHLKTKYAEKIGTLQIAKTVAKILVTFPFKEVFKRIN